MIRVETEGSFWTIDEERMVYMRMPKEEAPRDNSGRAEQLEDLRWHPFTSWRIRTERDLDCPLLSEDQRRLRFPELVILTPVGTGQIFAPKARLR